VRIVVGPAMRNEPPLDSCVSLVAPLSHPCYAGHFPGHPLVPGVLLLDLIVESLGRGPPRAVVNVKFHRVIKPGEGFELRCTSSGDRTAFRCVRGAELLAEGSLDFASS
jgi:3-hydroxyacyl-[acyl-carrier-protein] dehydratase